MFSTVSVVKFCTGADECDSVLTDVRALEESGITLRFNARPPHIHTHTHTLSLVTQQQTLALRSAPSETLHTDTIAYKQLGACFKITCL